jgi:hypothetical protein
VHLNNLSKVLNFYPHNYLVPNLVGYYGIPNQARGKHLSLLFAWHPLVTNTVLSKKCRKMEETFKHRRRIFVIIFVLYLQGVSLDSNIWIRTKIHLDKMVTLSNYLSNWGGNCGSATCLWLEWTISTFAYVLRWALSMLGLLSPSLIGTPHYNYRDTCWSNLWWLKFKLWQAVLWALLRHEFSWIYLSSLYIQYLGYG